MIISRKLCVCLLCFTVATQWKFGWASDRGGGVQEANGQEVTGRGEYAEQDMVAIPGGSFTPLFKDSTGVATRSVKPFLLDRYAVTNQQYYLFTQQQPKWGKNNVKAVFSDSNYLKHFVPEAMDDLADSPVTNVSWFSARAYCKFQNKRLPSLDEWEFVARASDTKMDGSMDSQYRQKILEWYSRPVAKRLPNVRDTEANYWGVHGMHGVVWELVNDINTALVTGESRADSQLEQQLFCGAGAISSVDPGDYAAFMRYALRSSYQVTYTMESLGFRCAKDAVESKDVLENTN